MSDQEKRIQEIIDDLKRKNLEYDEKEAYQDEFKRNVIIITALESLQRERQEPEPLTLEQITERLGMPVWIKATQRWGIVGQKYGCFGDEHYVIGSAYGWEWLSDVMRLGEIYATEPKGGLDGK